MVMVWSWLNTVAFENRHTHLQCRLYLMELLHLRESHDQVVHLTAGQRRVARLQLLHLPIILRCSAAKHVRFRACTCMPQERGRGRV